MYNWGVDVGTLRVRIIEIQPLPRTEYTYAAGGCKTSRSPDTASHYAHEHETAVNTVCVVSDAKNI